MPPTVDRPVDRALGHVRRGGGERDRERGALARRAVDADAAAAFVDDREDGRQAEAGAFAFGLGREERFEDLRLHVRRHPRSGVGDGNARPRAGRIGNGARADPQFAAARHGVARIDREIEERLLDLAAVAVDGRRGGIERGDQRDVLAEQAPRHRGQIRDERVDVEDGELARPLAAEGEELTRQRRGAIDGHQDLGQILLRHLVRQLGLEEARVAGDDGQQVVEIVRDAAGHPADDFHLLRLAQLRFEQPALGHVDERAHQPLGLPLGVAGDAPSRIDVAHRAARQRHLDVEVVVGAIGQRPVRRGEQRLAIVRRQPLSQLLERRIVPKFEQRRQRSRRCRAVRREVALIEADARRREHELVDRLALLQCGGLRLEAIDQHGIVVRHAGEAGEHAGELFITFAEWRGSHGCHREDTVHARRRRERRDHDARQGRMRRGKADACVPASGLANHAAAADRLTKRLRDLSRSQVLGRFPIAAARQDRRWTRRRFVEDRGDRQRRPGLLADRAAGHVEERHRIALGDEALSALGEHCEGRGHWPPIMVTRRESATTPGRSSA